MKKSFLIIIFISTAIVYFYFGCLFQGKKFESKISNLITENQTLQNKINNLEQQQNTEQNNVEDKDNDTSEYKHPIDIEEKKCIESSHVYDYPDCSKKSEMAWDKEIQNNLKSLKKVMTNEEYQYIEKMNTDWEKSVYNEINVINRFISDKDGIINQTTGYSHISNLKKQYALLLSSIYFTYTES